MNYEKIFSKLPSGWLVGTLDQFAEIIDPHPSHRAPAEVANGYPFLGIGDLDYYGNATFDAARHVGLEIIEEHERNYKISETSIGYAKMGNTIGKVVSFPSRQGKTRFAVSPALSVINPNEKIHPYYLRAVVESAAFWGQVNGKITGSTRPSIGIQQLRKILIPIPPAVVQTQIGEMWKVIFDKISVNTAINDNLLQQAQAIYTNMFISNADPAWEQGRLSDLITVKYGKDHKKLADGVYPVFGSGGIMRHVERPLYTGESVLIPRKGTLNNVIYVNEPFWSVDTMFFTEMKIPNVAKYVFHFVKAKDLASMNAGSAVPSMTTDILNAMELAIPSAERLAEFESVVAPMYQAMQANNRESAKLAELRDALLPKLMSGEVDVSSIQI